MIIMCHITKKTKDIIKLEVVHVNYTYLMKNSSIGCRSLSNFLAFRQMLKHHFSYFNVFIRNVKDTTRTNFSEPDGLLPNSDASNFMKYVMFSFLSKEGVLTDFPEGLQALALTRNGHESLNTVLGHTHAQMIDTWAY